MGGAYQRRRGLKKWGQDIAIFLKAAASFQQMRLWALKILILPPNYLQMEDFQPKFSILEEKFLTG